MEDPKIEFDSDEEDELNNNLEDSIELTDLDEIDDSPDGNNNNEIEEIIKVVEDDDLERKKAVRRKLEELAEKKSHEDTYAIDFDEK
tara:strand:+ start:98 stop:358 length:261 start_codon:yes stop_codon:yes gene_type:complete